jgi:hypothetical protein
MPLPRVPASFAKANEVSTLGYVRPAPPGPGLRRAA